MDNKRELDQVSNLLDYSELGFLTLPLLMQNYTYPMFSYLDYATCMQGISKNYVQTRGNVYFFLMQSFNLTPYFYIILSIPLYAGTKSNDYENRGGMSTFAYKMEKSKKKKKKRPFCVRSSLGFLEQVRKIHQWMNFPSALRGTKVKGSGNAILQVLIFITDRTKQFFFWLPILPKQSTAF